MIILALLVLILMTVPASAETFTWQCNDASYMKEYRGERSEDAGAHWGVLFAHPHVDGCSTLSYQNTAPVNPGEKLGRMVACNALGACSDPSGATPYVIPPAVVKPGDVTGLVASEITTTTATVTFPVPIGAKVNLRYAVHPIAWGSAQGVDCDASPCHLTGLPANTAIDLQAVAYFGTMNKDAIYGELSKVVTFTTVPTVSDLEKRVADIETMGAALAAEVQDLRTTIQTLCRDLGGKCP